MNKKASGIDWPLVSGPVFKRGKPGRSRKYDPSCLIWLVGQFIYYEALNEIVTEESSSPETGTKSKREWTEQAERKVKRELQTVKKVIDPQHPATEWTNEPSAADERQITPSSHSAACCGLPPIHNM
ncbi:MAG: hypothetical protein GXY92_01290 [Syntrophomonadaceae bacterium]|nr:hypothetical protein [Syntrophomonadaceae bacterium]